MICEKCRAAGRALKYGGAESEDESGGQLLAVYLHNQCRGGTWCDCQHQLSPGVK